MRQYALPVQGLGFSTPALSVSPSLEWLKDPCFKSVIYETEERKEQENKQEQDKKKRNSSSPLAQLLS